MVGSVSSACSTIPPPDPCSPRPVHADPNALMSPRPTFPLRKSSSGPGALDLRSSGPGWPRGCPHSCWALPPRPPTCGLLSHPPVPCPPSSQAQVRCHVAPTRIPPRLSVSSELAVSEPSPCSFCTRKSLCLKVRPYPARPAEMSQVGEGDR